MQNSGNYPKVQSFYGFLTNFIPKAVNRLTCFKILFYFKTFFETFDYVERLGGNFYSVNPNFTA